MVGDEAGGAKERPNVGELFSKPSAGSAGVESALLGLLGYSRRRSAIATAGIIRRAVWGPLLLPLAAALLEGFQPSFVYRRIEADSSARLRFVSDWGDPYCATAVCDSAREQRRHRRKDCSRLR